MYIRVESSVIPKALIIFLNTFRFIIHPDVFRKISKMTHPNAIGGKEEDGVFMDVLQTLTGQPRFYVDRFLVKSVIHEEADHN